jgi:hypothetical protein
VFAFPYFWLLDTGSPRWILVAQVIGMSVLYCGISGAQPGPYAELFEPDIRMTAISITRELSAPITGGTAPFIATALLIASGGRSWPIALCMVGVCAITIASLVGLRRFTGPAGDCQTSGVTRVVGDLPAAGREPAVEGDVEGVEAGFQRIDQRR